MTVSTVPSTASTAVSLPVEAYTLTPQAIFALGKVAVAYENRAWAREKVKVARANLHTDKANLSTYGMYGDCGSSYESAYATSKTEFAVRDQALLSLEKFYKKMRYALRDNHPEAMPIMALMIPGSTQGM